MNTLILSNVEAPAARLLESNLILATFSYSDLFEQLSYPRQYLPDFDGCTKYTDILQCCTKHMDSLQSCWCSVLQFPNRPNCGNYPICFHLFFGHAISHNLYNE